MINTNIQNKKKKINKCIITYIKLEKNLYQINKINYSSNST